MVFLSNERRTINVNVAAVVSVAAVAVVNVAAVAVVKDAELTDYLP